jgi:molybdopterin-binding protein
MALLTVRAAAERLGIGYSTLKQWIYQGRIRTTSTPGGHHRIAEAEIERLIAGQTPAHRRDPRIGTRPTGLIVALSGRNRLRGFVEEVRIDGLLGQVRLRIGDQVLTAVITADALQELKLRRGDDALAIVKSTEVMIAREVSEADPPRRRKPAHRAEKRLALCPHDVVAPHRPPPREPIRSRIAMCARPCSDEASSVQRTESDGDALPPDPHHVRELIVRERQLVRSEQIAGLQQPAGAAAVRRVKGNARRRGHTSSGGQVRMSSEQPGQERISDELRTQRSELHSRRDAAHANDAIERHLIDAVSDDVSAGHAVPAHEADIHGFARLHRGHERNQSGFGKERGFGRCARPEEQFADAQRYRANVRGETILDAARELCEQPVAGRRHVRPAKSDMNCRDRYGS